MKRSLHVALITVGCVATYAGMRMLPVEPCEFLHYGEFINNEGVIEGCGYEETEFFIMDEIRFPIIADLIPLMEPQVGEETPFKLTLFTTSGKPINWHEIAVSHTERVHAMVVDRSLDDYQHLHPQPAGPAGHYLVNITPNKPGPYSVYLDFIPLINSRRTLLETGFEVTGQGSAPTPGHRLTTSIGPYTFSFDPLQERQIPDEELQYRLLVEHKEGKNVRFSPVMDSYAHVVAFDQAGRGFAHLHPLNPFIEGQDPYNPELTFAFLFDKPGFYRVWAQVIINDEQIFIPFDLTVEDPAILASAT